MGMASFQFKIRGVDYSEHPWFGSDSLIARLNRGELSETVPVFSRSHIHHSSNSEFLDRSRLSVLLQQYNKLVGNPLSNSTVHAIQTDGRFVLTGHQPVLLTGPLFTFLKVVSIISLSRRLEQISQTPLIPGIWIATEDHDLPEVNRCVVNGQKFVWDKCILETGHMPQVGEISLKGCREHLLKFLHDALPHNDFFEWIMDMVGSCNFEDYGKLFATLLQKIFKDWPVVFIDPIALRPVSAPVLASIVGQWEDIKKAFERGKEMLRRNRISPPLSTLNIFKIAEGRRIKFNLNKHVAEPSPGAKNFAPAADLIRSRPMDFSPGAALRPLLQDAVIPTMVYIGGPDELLYSWQISPLYLAAGITRSKLFPRISTTILENNIKKAAICSGLYPDQIFYVRDFLSNYKPDITVLDKIEELEAVSQKLLDCIDCFKTDQNKKWLNKSRDAIQYNLEKIRRKLAEEKLHEMGLGRKNLEKISNSILPSGKPQERVVNIFQFLGRYGPDFISRSLELFDPENLCHQVAEIEPNFNLGAKP